MKFRESALAHQLLGGMDGIEIGGSAHNAFGLKTRNVDFTDSMDTVFKRAELELCGEAMPVDIVARADKLPLADASVGFVISSHVLEHVYDVIGCLLEWNRVVRPGGYVFVIVPKPDALATDAGRPLTTLVELIDRYGKPDPDIDCHWNVWTHEQGRELIAFMQQPPGSIDVSFLGGEQKSIQPLPWQVVSILETDDKVGNGWCFVVRKST